MANLIEKVDFNGDKNFTGKDLDITWAYLQVKKRYEDEQAAGGATTINLNNFKAEVIKQYELNQTGTIAESPAPSIKSLPGTLDLAALSGDFKTKFEKIWTFNDMFEGTDTKNRPDELWESVVGESAGSIYKGTWASASGTDQRLLTLSSSGFVQLFDRGTLRNDKSWTLFISGKTTTKLYKNSGQEIFTKGGLRIKLYPDKISGSSSYGDSTYWRYPGGSKGVDSGKNYTDKNLELYLVKDGIEINLYLNGVLCPKSAEGSQPRLLSLTDTKTQPLKLPGIVWKTIFKVYITDNLFLDDAVLPTDGTYIGEATEWTIRSDLNLTNSFFAFRQFVQDRYSNFIKFGTDSTKKGKAVGVYYGDSPAAQMRWNDLPTGGTHFGFDITDRAKCLNLMWPNMETKKYRNKPEYLDIPNVDFRSNFTLSFWVRTARYADVFLEFVPDVGTGVLGFGFDKAAEKCGWQKPGITTYNKFSGKNSLNTSHPPKDTWYHFAFVKNGSFIGTWVNGTFSKWSGAYEFSDADMDNIGACTIRLIGDKYTYLYLADLRFVKYAMSHIPHADYGKRSTFPFIDLLKSRENS